MGEFTFVIGSLVFLLGGISGGYSADALEKPQVGFLVELQDGSRIRGRRISSPSVKPCGNMMRCLRMQSLMTSVQESTLSPG